MTLRVFPILRSPHTPILRRELPPRPAARTIASRDPLSPRSAGGDVAERQRGVPLSLSRHDHTAATIASDPPLPSASPPAERGERRGWIEQQSVRLLTLLLRGYQLLLSPLFAALGSQCRFEPSCSQYMIDAVQLRGPVVGLALGVWRILRCNPLNPGGYDPAPPSASRARPLAPHGDECQT